MFTGLIEATGRIESLTVSPDGGRLVVRTTLSAELEPGESIAVNGVCLTVTEHDVETFTVDVAPTTLEVTSLGRLEPGRLLNLERSLPAYARVGGHFVLGHVDTTGLVAALRPDGDAHWLEIEIPPMLEPLVIPRGSIAVDGISLTIAALARGRLAVQIVPFTFAHTSIGQTQVGDPVNLEADVLGKYVVRLLEHQLANVAAITKPRADPT
jgi:riboflavin synthase